MAAPAVAVWYLSLAAAVREGFLAALALVDVLLVLPPHLALLRADLLQLDLCRPTEPTCMTSERRRLRSIACYLGA